MNREHIAFPMMRTLPGLGPQRSPIVVDEILPVLSEVDRSWEALLENSVRRGPARRTARPRQPKTTYILGVVALCGLLVGATGSLLLNGPALTRAHAAAFELVPRFSSAALYKRAASSNH